MPVEGIPADGARKVVEFAPREVGWVRFTATGGTGQNVGLGELEVYDDRDMGATSRRARATGATSFDPSTGFIRPKDAAGDWLEPFDPLSPEDFVEANSWQATWFASHDVMGLANAMGGEETFASKLDFAFRSAEPAGFIGDYGDGYVSYGNQPGLQIAHLFNYVGRPWLTQHWVREVKQRVTARRRPPTATGTTTRTRARWAR